MRTVAQNETKQAQAIAFEKLAAGTISGVWSEDDWSVSPANKKALKASMQAFAQRRIKR